MGFFARCVILVGALGLAAATACSDDEPEAFCATAARACGSDSACDATLAAQCTPIEAVVSAPTLTGARDCLQSGVCGGASCLGRARTSAAISNTHAVLARHYCQFCAPSQRDCEAGYFGPDGAGLLVRGYADAIVAAVDDACTGAPTCKDTFAACARATVTDAAATAMPAALATCVVEALSPAEGAPGPVGPPVVNTCTPANCKGCCRNDLCETGDTADACGTGAASCQTCYGTQACEDGSCKAPCGPDNCAGCCRDGACEQGSVDASCGARGAACKDCKTQGAGFVCSNQTCIDGSCSASCTDGCCNAAGCQTGEAADACGTGGAACIDCGAGRTCSRSKACTLDAAARWDVYVSFAILPAARPDGTAWDASAGAPDPYLTLEASEGDVSHAGRTTTVTNTRLPVWGETALVNVTAGELVTDLVVKAWDEDDGDDAFMGGCKLTVNAAMFDGSLQSQTCPATASAGEVKLAFRIRQH